MAIDTTSIAHVRLTVTDIDAIAAVLRERVRLAGAASRCPRTPTTRPANSSAFLFGGVIYDLGDSLVGLRPVAADRFDEDRAGLDHLAFRIGQQGRIR